MRIFVCLLIVFSFVFNGCRKDPDPIIIPDPPLGNDTVPDTTATDTVPSGTSDITVRFVAVMGNATITSSTGYYSNGMGDQVTVSLFNYYISNVKLKKADGSTYAVPDSYYLIKHMEGRDSLVLKNIPAGYYTHAEFLIGVDSLRNVSGAQSGALDPGHNMFWDWNTGYIFYKLEGEYNSASSITGSYAFHIGGFSGSLHCLRTATVSLGSVRADKKSRYIATVKSDAAAVFKDPHDIGIDTYNVQGASLKMFSMQADNYADMFTFVSGRTVPAQ